MNKKVHLLEVAEEDLEDARAFEVSDPEKSLKFIISRYEALAAYYLANNDDSFEKCLSKAIESKLKCINDFGKEISPEEQIDYIFYSLAVCNIGKAKEFASISTDYQNSHAFDVRLSCKLRELLEIPLLSEVPDYKPIKSEVGLFQTIENLISQASVDWELLGKYWLSTKSKRYQLTLFEDADLFSKALKYVQQCI